MEDERDDVTILLERLYARIGAQLTRIEGHGYADQNLLTAQAIRHLSRAARDLEDILNTRPASEKAMPLDTLREPLAAYAHDAWSGWMTYLFGVSQSNPDGTVTIPAWAVERWQRQRQASYADLSNEEKGSDLAEADKMLRIFQATYAQHRTDAPESAAPHE